MQDKWDTLVSCVQGAARAAIPNNIRPMADWFLEKEHIIRPGLEKRSGLLTTWLAKEEDSQNHLKQKGAVQRMIRQIQNQWYQSKASEIEHSTRGSGGAWKSVRQLQQAGRGMRPVITYHTHVHVCKHLFYINNRYSTSRKKVKVPGSLVIRSRFSRGSVAVWSRFGR